MNTEIVDKTETQEETLQEPSQALIPTVIPIAELEKINATDKGLAELRAKAKLRASIGIRNKADREEAHQIMMVAVKVRTKSKEIAENAAAPFKEKYDAIIAEGKRIGDHAKESEKIVRELRDEYDKEQERLAHERTLAQQQRMEGRVNQLRAWGFAWNPVNEAYEALFVAEDLPEGSRLSINFDDIKELSDEDYEPTFNLAKLNYENHVAELARQESIRQAEADRIAAEQKAEADRLAEKARLLQEQQAEIRRQQEELLAAQKRIQDEKDALTLKERTLKLVELGFTVTPKGVLHEDYAHYPEAVILNMTEEDFAETIADFKQWQIEESTRKEQERIQAEKDQALLAERIERLLAAGFVEDCGCYTRPNVTIKPERILLFSDELFDHVIEEAVQYFEQKKQDQIDAEAAEQARIKADQERTERLEPEKKIIRNYLIAIGKIKRPISLQEPETVEFLDQLTRSLDQVVTQQLELLEQL